MVVGADVRRSAKSAQQADICDADHDAAWHKEAEEIRRLESANTPLADGAVLHVVNAKWVPPPGAGNE